MDEATKIHSNIVNSLSEHKDDNLYPFQSNIKIIIKVHPSDTKRRYKITKIELENHLIEDDEEAEYPISELDQGIYGFVIKQNEELQSSNEYPEEWNSFYMLKELIQFVENFKFKSNLVYPLTNSYNIFYRGQNHNFNLLPGIARSKQYDVERLAENFELIYKDLCYEYQELKYVPINLSTENDNLVGERVTQLALLQHYGFPTPLIDVTSSPFVGMFFLAHEFNVDTSFMGEIETPSLTIFMAKKHVKNSLFQRAEVNPVNHRLKPQNGSFIDYEMLSNEVKSSSDHAFHIVFQCDQEGVEEKDLKNMYDCIRKDIDCKLEEYHYRYIDLFPELENRADYIKNIYKPKPKDQSIYE
ncbi:FRG domain-containing protein [Weissella fangxianensis]|uniref:FRG domain-containing protein n=1 Tax=Weissella fangxianensis TaxID=2953879 RepID=UPI0021588D33|nr:FRG domain-containing protein [Weissella fangxianensis]